MDCVEGCLLDNVMFPSPYSGLYISILKNTGYDNVRTRFRPLIRGYISQLASRRMFNKSVVGFRPLIRGYISQCKLVELSRKEEFGFRPLIRGYISQ